MYSRETLSNDDCRIGWFGVPRISEKVQKPLFPVAFGLFLLEYTVSKKLVKVPQHADLLPHVAAMRRTNRLGRTRKPPAQTPAPAPAPSTEPAPSSTQHV
jgi:hypothetical protein